jgi:anti-anti-sigma regulatory factor
MADKDSNSLGLLSKVAMFVRHPTKDWSELDNLARPPDDNELGYSKQALKQLIERKRQNDFVRRREFDQLRKLRRAGPSLSPELAARPSFFQSSMASGPGERANTIKKIDEIEAQMSRQWWRGKQDGAPANADAVPTTPSGLPTNPEAGAKSATAFASTEVSSLEAGQTSAPETSARASWAPAGADGTAAEATGPQGRATESALSEFSASKLLSVELGEGMTDPQLEEAAIRFANGDDAGAEAGLLAALQGAASASDLTEIWASALFDLYRATGQQASFDVVAVDYAERFGRSAPAWFSTPELLGQGSSGGGRGQNVRAALGPDARNWKCPAALDASAVHSLMDSTGDMRRPCLVDWAALQHIQGDALGLLAGLMAQWCTLDVQLHFAGTEVLDRVLRGATPSGDKAVAPDWWKLRLDVLRILRRQDEFELAALEYCITFEMSPPSWSDPLCNCAHDGSPADTTAPLPLEAEAQPEFGDATQAMTLPMSLEVPLMGVESELNGEVLGDASQLLERLQGALKSGNRLVVSCARLVRVDFSAAGSILNWVAARQAEGITVVFRDVPRLVAVFFSVIGISEHARVLPRTG